MRWPWRERCVHEWDKVECEGLPQDEELHECARCGDQKHTTYTEAGMRARGFVLGGETVAGYRFWIRVEP